jgi:hypothetical protein
MDFAQVEVDELQTGVRDRSITLELSQMFDPCARRGLVFNAGR